MSDELDAYLAALPDQILGQLSNAIREQAELLSDAQRAALRSLEQPPEETGSLEASCVVVTGANPLEFIVQAGGETTTSDVRDGSGVPYDHALAFKFGNSRQPARPFFYNTYQAMRDDMQSAIDEAMQEALK